MRSGRHRPAGTDSGARELRGRGSISGRPRPFPRSLRARRPALIRAGLTLGAAAGAALLFFFDPARWTSLYPSCPFNSLTGLHCPGCGSTRAFHALLHGDLAGAFWSNPLLAVVLPVLGWSVFLRWRAIGSGEPAWESRLKSGWIWALLAVILVFAVVRNIPYPPFSFLAP